VRSRTTTFMSLPSTILEDAETRSASHAASAEGSRSMHVQTTPTVAPNQHHLQLNFPLCGPQDRTARRSRPPPVNPLVEQPDASLSDVETPREDPAGPGCSPTAATAAHAVMSPIQDSIAAAPAHASTSTAAAAAPAVLLSHPKSVDSVVFPTTGPSISSSPDATPEAPEPPQHPEASSFDPTPAVAAATRLPGSGKVPIAMQHGLHGFLTAQLDAYARSEEHGGSGAGNRALLGQEVIQRLALAGAAALAPSESEVQDAPPHAAEVSRNSQSPAASAFAVGRLGPVLGVSPIGSSIHAPAASSRDADKEAAAAGHCRSHSPSPSAAEVGGAQLGESQAPTEQKYTGQAQEGGGEGNRAQGNRQSGSGSSGSGSRMVSAPSKFDSNSNSNAQSGGSSAGSGTATGSNQTQCSEQTTREEVATVQELSEHSWKTHTTASRSIRVSEAGTEDSSVGSVSLSGTRVLTSSGKEGNGDRYGSGSGGTSKPSAHASVDTERYSGTSTGKPSTGTAGPGNSAETAACDRGTAPRTRQRHSTRGATVDATSIPTEPKTNVQRPGAVSGTWKGVPNCEGMVDVEVNTDAALNARAELVSMLSAKSSEKEMASTASLSEMTGGCRVAGSPSHSIQSMHFMDSYKFPQTKSLAAATRADVESLNNTARVFRRHQVGSFVSSSLQSQTWESSGFGAGMRGGEAVASVGSQRMSAVSSLGALQGDSAGSSVQARNVQSAEESSLGGSGVRKSTLQDVRFLVGKASRVSLNAMSAMSQGTPAAPMSGTTSGGVTKDQEAANASL
jgi:hypothetical protein